MATSINVLNVSRGGFIDQAGVVVITSEKPATIIGVTVSTLSLVFTVATLLALVIGCALNKKEILCLRRVRSLRTRQHTSSRATSKSCMYRRCKKHGATERDSELVHKAMSGNESLLDNEEGGIEHDIVKSV